MVSSLLLNLHLAGGKNDMSCSFLLLERMLATAGEVPFRFASFAQSQTSLAVHRRVRLAWIATVEARTGVLRSLSC